MKTPLPKQHCEKNIVVFTEYHIRTLFCNSNQIVLGLSDCLKYNMAATLLYNTHNHKMILVKTIIIIYSVYVEQKQSAGLSLAPF